MYLKENLVKIAGLKYYDLNVKNHLGGGGGSACSFKKKHLRLSVA
jgi:hypothetical protein